MPKVTKKTVDYRPENDWTCREVLDAKVIDPLGKFACEFCGTSIRWIHVLEHDDYHCSMRAGCCCAVRLCFDYDAEAAEQELKNHTVRLMRFVDLRRWNRSRPNPENIWRWVRLPDRKNVRVTVFLKDGRYGVCHAGRKDGDCYFHWEKYATQSEALSVAFELVERLKEEGG